jgi:hypothetical protein
MQCVVSCCYDSQGFTWQLLGCDNATRSSLILMSKHITIIHGLTSLSEPAFETYMFQNDTCINPGVL